MGLPDFHPRKHEVRLYDFDAGGGKNLLKGRAFLMTGGQPRIVKLLWRCLRDRTIDGSKCRGLLRARTHAPQQNGISIRSPCRRVQAVRAKRRDRAPWRS